jgi:hypothetical protein
MTDDRLMAELLGDEPLSPDPGFRVDVLALVAERGRRRAAQRRALGVVAVFFMIGLAFPLIATVETAVRDFQLLLAGFGAMGIAYLAALLSISGPKAVWARSLSALRVSL